jgi:hypothetical protein
MRCQRKHQAAGGRNPQNGQRGDPPAFMVSGIGKTLDWNQLKRELRLNQKKSVSRPQQQSHSPGCAEQTTANTHPDPKTLYHFPPFYGGTCLKLQDIFSESR